MTRTADSTLTAALPGQRASLGTVLRDEIRVLLVALEIVIASFWICGPLGAWDVAAFLTVGVLLALVNHIAAEYSLLKVLASGREATRAEMTRQALGRLLGIGLAAGAVAVVFWSTGIVTLIGLALFRLITLVMTGLPLLKELKRQ